VFGPSGTAAKLGIHRATLESKISSLKIDKYGFKTDSASKNSWRVYTYSTKTLRNTLKELSATAGLGHSASS
jgi:hypothetical protein